MHVNGWTDTLWTGRDEDVPFLEETEIRVCENLEMEVKLGDGALRGGVEGLASGRGVVGRAGRHLDREDGEGRATGHVNRAEHVARAVAAPR